MASEHSIGGTKRSCKPNRDGFLADRQMSRAHHFVRSDRIAYRLFGKTNAKHGPECQPQPINALTFNIKGIYCSPGIREYAQLALV
jgi:hypothetical protein